MSDFPFQSTQWDLLALHLEILAEKSKEDARLYLQTLEAENPDLAAQLYTLVRSDESWGSHLEHQSSARFMTLTEEEFVSLEGEQAGYFKLTTFLDKGGMCEVYKGVRTDGLSQTAAIKVLRYVTVNPQLLRNFEQEQRILSNLQHPNIAYFLDAGFTSGGFPFMAMEYIQGMNLSDWCETKQCTLEERIRLIIQVCDALQYLHNHMVVHLDIKPGNIIVDENGHLRLLDFGISKLLRDEQDEQTNPFLTALTPSFASPEQLLGKPATALADLYAVGVTLYFLIAGKLPYNINGLQQDDPMAVLRGSIVAPGVEAIGRFKKGRKPDRDLDAITLKAMHLVPEERYATLEALKSDLLNWLQGNVVLARQTSWGDVAIKWIRRNRKTSAFIGVLVLLLFIGAALLGWQTWRVQQNMAKANATVGFLENVLIGYDPFSAQSVQQDSTEAQQLIRRSLAYLHTIPHESPEVRARILNLLSQIALARDLFSQADSLNQEAAKLIRQTNATLEKGYIAYQQSKIALTNGDYKEGVKIAFQGLQWVSGNSLEEEKARVDFYALLVEGYGSLDDMKQAWYYQQEAKQLVLRIWGNTSLEYAHHLAEQARLAYFDHKPAQSVRWMEQAVTLYKRYYPAEAPYFATLYNNLSIFYQDTGQQEKALAAIQESLRINKAVFGETGDSTLQAKSNLAIYWYEQGNADQAIQLLKEIIRISRQFAPQRIHNDLHNLMVIQFTKGALGEAEQLGREVLGLRLKSFSEDHRDVLNTTSYYADILFFGGKTFESARYYQQLMERTTGKPDLIDLYLRGVLGMAYVAFEQHKLSAMHQYLDDISTSVRQASESMQQQYEALQGLYLIQTGQREEGRRTLKNALSGLEKKSNSPPAMLQYLQHWLK